MESGEGENLEKCSMCFGTLAKAAFFIINLTNFIIAEAVGLLCWSSTSDATMLLRFYLSEPAIMLPLRERAGRRRGEESCGQWEGGDFYLRSALANEESRGGGLSNVWVFPVWSLRRALSPLYYVTGDQQFRPQTHKQLDEQV